MRGVIRGTYAAGRRRSGGAKFVWERYSLTSGIDEASATTGSVSLSSTRTKMAASAYTISGTNFVLTSPVSTQAQNLTVGQYLVNVTTSNNTATSGTYLYRITNITTSGSTYNRTYNISYTRYSVATNAKGTLLDTVESETMDYPIDGVQSGYWYVMVKGEYTQYVWDVYIDNVNVVQDGTGRGAVGATGSIMTATDYSVDRANNIFVLVSPVSTAGGSIARNLYAVNNTAPPGISQTDISGTRLYKINSGTTMSGSGNNRVYAFDYLRYAIEHQKGALLSSPAESPDPAAYPQDGAQDGYWYTYSHSYLYTFDNR